MSAVAAAARRAAELPIERPPSPPAAMAPLDILVTGLAAGAGASTVARGVAVALRRLRPVALSGRGDAAAVAAGPGVAVVRDTTAAVAGAVCHNGPGRVVVAVADARREAAVAALVCDVLARRHERVVLVGNRVRDQDAWRERGAVCVPESRAGVLMVDRGRRPFGPMGAAFDLLAARVLAP
jgi:hypothetical protein